MVRFAQYAAAFVWMLLLAGPGIAQTAFPSKPVRVIVPGIAGSGLDIVARLIAQKLGEAWKQPVIVENRGGASGAIGTQAAARSPADGYTLLAAAPGETVLASIVSQRTGFDPLRELRPVSLIGISPLALLAHASFPASTLGELVALARARPGAIFYATAGVGSSHHLAGELVKLQTGMNLGVVNYPSMAPAINDALGGQVPLVLSGFPPIRAHVKSGRLKVITVIASRRSPLEPEWPALGEGGPVGHDITTWLGLFGPAQLPPEIAASISREVARIVKLPDVIERMIALGAEVHGSTPEEFSAFLKAEETKYRTILKESGLKLE